MSRAEDLLRPLDHRRLFLRLVGFERLFEKAGSKGLNGVVLDGLGDPLFETGLGQPEPSPTRLSSAPRCRRPSRVPRVSRSSPRSASTSAAVLRGPPPLRPRGRPATPSSPRPARWRTAARPSRSRSRRLLGRRPRAPGHWPPRSGVHAVCRRDGGRRRAEPGSTAPSARSPRRPRAPPGAPHRRRSPGLLDKVPARGVAPSRSEPPAPAGPRAGLGDRAEGASLGARSPVRRIGSGGCVARAIRATLDHSRSCASSGLLSAVFWADGLAPQLALGGPQLANALESAADLHELRRRRRLFETEHRNQRERPRRGHRCGCHQLRHNSATARSAGSRPPRAGDDPPEPARRPPSRLR